MTCTRRSQEAGLPKVVHAYWEQFSASCTIPIACEADESVGDLSRGAALALFRIVQEALGNAAKHGAAKRIVVRLTRSEGVVWLAVSDDVAGFDQSLLASGGGLGVVIDVGTCQSTERHVRVRERPVAAQRSCR